ncbi:MAG TPA: hypothetical protein EYQ81_12275, partial [Sneathiellales bacterium]|nr:hypothetical protein [Sneathiellales bacterium]
MVGNGVQQANVPVLHSAVDHLNRVASVPIRNIASVGGNLMVCHEHTDSQTAFFPSDVA